MARKYTKAFKKKLVEKVRLEKKSTKKTAEENNVPLKTFEKWITKYNKDPEYFEE